MPDVPPVEEVRIGSDLAIGGEQPPLFLAGPCVIESRDHCLALAERLAGIAERLGARLIFKASFDKANRTSRDSFRGPGLEVGLRILEEVRGASGLPVTSDVHESVQVEAAAEVLDLLQIPAFLCRQTDLLEAAGRSGRVVNVKKGPFLAAEDMEHVAAKVRGAGGACIATERGTSFGHRDLVVDFRGLTTMRELGLPVVFDATHATQRPGARAGSSGGDRAACAPLARAAAACGVDGFFMEVHDHPAEALSDPATQVTPEHFEEIVPLLLDLSARVRGRGASAP